MFVSNDIIHKREIEACHEQAGVGMAAECFGGAAGFGRHGRIVIALSGADRHAAVESEEQGCETECAEGALHDPRCLVPAFDGSDLE